MIYGKLSDAARFNYYGLGKRFSIAFGYLEEVRRSGEHKLGKTEIAGDEIWANGICKPAKKADDLEFELHRRYADVHWCMTGRERIEWHGDTVGLEPSTAFDEERDFGMLRGPAVNHVVLEDDYFVILFPNEPHAPLLGEGMIAKVCVKVAMTP